MPCLGEKKHGLPNQLRMKAAHLRAKKQKKQVIPAEKCSVRGNYATSVFSYNAEGLSAPGDSRDIGGGGGQALVQVLNITSDVVPKRGRLHHGYLASRFWKLKFHRKSGTSTAPIIPITS
uniref:Uncharacterized protein n=1 Tax=Arundo donax TaxID=35708 RepID=A0A0A9CZX7_ARUDO